MASTSHEVETDGDLAIEIRVDGAVRLVLRWSGIPGRGELPGWTSEPGGVAWPWDPDAERQLAQLMDALHDHRRRPAGRSEMRVHFWERHARDASAVGAAAWGRALADSGR